MTGNQAHPPASRSSCDDTPPVLIVGLGWLGTAVATELRQRGAAPILPFDVDGKIGDLRDAVRTAGAVIGCSDAPSSLPRILSDLCEERVPLISCELTAAGARVQIGNPRASSAGCPSCDAAFRAGRSVLEAAIGRHLDQDMPARVPWRFRHRAGDLATAATFVAFALADALRAAERGSVADTRVHILDFDERIARAHPAPRHFACRRCWPHPSLSIDALRDDAQGRWAPAWDTICAPRDIVEIGETLESLVDPDSGLFESTWMSGAAERRAIAALHQDRSVKPDDTPFMDAARAVVARSRIRGPRRELVASEGFDFTNPDTARALALIEGLERLFALDHVDPSRSVRVAYAAVADKAIDPRELPLFSEAQYREPGFPFRRFDPNVEMNWLWGIRVESGVPVLVPEDLIDGRGPDAIVRATSNGAACHSSLHHAVLNGLYEVVERDALMVAWLNRQSHPRVRLSLEDPDPHGVRAAFARLSFRLTHVDITTDLGVPVVLAVLEDRRDPHLFISSMVAGLSRSRILDKLYREITQFTYPHLVDGSRYRTSTSSSDDPADVQTLPHHLEFYQNSARRDLTAFLTASREEREFATLPETAGGSIVEEIQRVTARLGAAGYDPIVVDCTIPFLREMGLWVVKVIVPGLQPLDVGHGRAALGGRRLTGTPNLWPHPFW